MENILVYALTVFMDFLAIHHKKIYNLYLFI